MSGWLAGSQLASSLLGGFFQADAQREANAVNQSNSREQMNFQRFMSDTSHQREVSDLSKAGLNPVLSASRGASTPAGSVSVAQPVNHLSGLADGVSKGVSTAIDKARLDNELKSADADRKLVAAQTATAGTQAQLNSANATTAQANAKRAEMETRALEKQFPALDQEVEYRKEYNQKRRKFIDNELLQRQVSPWISSGKDLMNMFVPRIRIEGGHSSGEYTDEYYDGQGEHTGSRTRRYPKRR